MAKPIEMYFSTDIETSGPIPPTSSILSLGSVAFLPDGKVIDTYEINMDLLPTDVGDPKTMAWWDTQPIAWEYCRRNPQPPGEAIKDYINWVNHTTAGKYSPVFVAYPAGFDFTFVYWYIMNFVGRSPFSFSALDIKSYASAVLKRPYRECTKKNFPRSWFKGAPPHDHTALADALGQMHLFLAMLNEGKNVR
jgi:hypothetical protein